MISDFLKTYFGNSHSIGNPKIGITFTIVNIRSNIKQTDLCTNPHTFTAVKLLPIGWKSDPVKL
jgi:hypothetical protein